MTLESSLFQNISENTFSGYQLYFSDSPQRLRQVFILMLKASSMIGWSTPIRNLTGQERHHVSINMKTFLKFIDKLVLVTEFASVQQLGWTLIEHIVSKETILLRVQNFLWAIFRSFITFWWSLSYQLNSKLKTALRQFFLTWNIFLSWYLVDSVSTWSSEFLQE